MNNFMLIVGLSILMFCVAYPLKYAGTTEPSKQGIIFGCIFGIGISISIIIKSLNNIL